MSQSYRSVSSVVCLSAITSFVATTQSASADYMNDFTNPATASQFSTDRANPGGFDVNTSNPGDLTINVRTADAPGQENGFFNVHGIATNGGDFNAGYGSILSASLFVPTNWANNVNRRAGDLWARINNPLQPNVGLHNYPTVGIYHYGGASPTYGPFVSLFTPTPGGFDGNPLTDDLILDLTPGTGGVPLINYDNYNTLALRLVAGGTVDYLFNDIVVASITDATYNQVGVEIEQALLQGWQGADDYTVRFGSLSVVPEPTTLSLIAGAGLMTLRRRRA